MSRRLVAVATIAFVAACLGACVSPSSLQTVQPAAPPPAQPAAPTSSSVAGTVEGWDVIISVASTLTAGRQLTSIVKAVNSTEATLSTRPLLHLVVRDAAGKAVPTGEWQKYIRAPHAVAPGASVSYADYFTVPAPGHYTISLAGMVDSSGASTGAAFTSVQ